MTIQSVSSASTVLVIDAAVADYETLAAGVAPGVDVVILDADQDGIAQITAALQGRSPVTSLQIVSHGAAGTVQLGSTQLSAENLDQYSAQFQQWRSALIEGADLLLYGCNVGSRSIVADQKSPMIANSFMQRLSQLTGADVAASEDVTGAGGNWTLEVATGAIASSMALKPSVTASYQSSLNSITVTTAADSGAGSLRAAIAAATPGSTIRFGTNLANQTIRLTSGQLTISPGKNLTIDGSGVANLTISGNNASRIFWVNSNQDFPTSLTVKNLTLANAYTADQGGAIKGEHKANVTVENVSFKGNVADKGGGAIYSAWENNLSVMDSLFDGNQAIAANDERGAGAIAFVSPGSLTVRNSTFTNNKGINGAAINSLNGLLTVENSKFINNDTSAAFFATGKPNDFLRGYGGAIYTDRANNAVTIQNSVFDGNLSKAAGGALYLFADPDDTVTIESSSFLNNKAVGLAGGEGGSGGAIDHVRNSLNASGSLTLRDVTLANNTASGQGGGLWVNNTRTTIVNSTVSGNRVLGTTYNNVGGGLTLYSPTDIINTTIANNRAGWVGGGVSASSSAAVTAKNTIFYNNTADNGTNNWGIQQHTSRELTDNGGNIQWPPKRTNNWNDYNATAQVRLVDPQLGALQDNGGGFLTHALLSGSPAINKGVVAGAPSFDQRGYRRDGLVDSGAFEVGGVPTSSPGSGGTPSGTVAIPVGASSDILLGTPAKDTLLGSAARDILLGGLSGDVQRGRGGSDRFLYSGATQRAAFAASLLSQPDRIADFSAAQKDKIQLDYDGNLGTVQRPRGLFNAGAVKGKTLAAATRAAYGDKNQRIAGKQSLKAKEAVFFTWRRHAYLSVNDHVTAFAGAHDLVVDMTGLKMAGRDASAGVLRVTNYFA